MKAKTAAFNLAAVVYVLVLAVCPIGLARTIRVANNGSAEYATIQAAIDASIDGDLVLVVPGTYRGDGNRDIDFKGKAITVRSEAGPATCVVNCQGSESDYHRGFYFHNGEGTESLLDGLTITGGYHVIGGGVRCFQSSPTIRNCVIRENVAGGGAGIATGKSDSAISNCVIVGNRTYSLGGNRDGGGLLCGSGHPIVWNCTIHANRSGGVGGGVVCGPGSGTALFVNCTIVGNTSFFPNGTQLFSGGCTMITGCPDIEIINCCIAGDPNAIFVENWSDPYKLPENCISVDPLFARPGYWNLNGTPENSWDDFWVNGDCHLKSQAGRWDPNSGSWVQDDVTSPCIDAGDPNSPIGDEPFPNGGRINIGAYGGTAEASKSYFGEPVSQTIIAGDINGDGKVDWLDLDILARNWLRDVRE